jgi:hypothetical protein
LAALLVYGLVMARRTIDPEQTQAFTEGPLLSPDSPFEVPAAARE